MESNLMKLSKPGITKIISACEELQELYISRKAWHDGCPLCDALVEITEELDISDFNCSRCPWVHFEGLACDIYAGEHFKGPAAPLRYNMENEGWIELRKNQLEEWVLKLKLLVALPMGN